MAKAEQRCWWCGTEPDYVAYHDHEWGMPVVDDRRLFEKLCLEGFQAGLSWLTILRKRENFRTAFAGFDIDTVAGFGQADVARLLADAGIVRHRGKIEAAIGNARLARDMVEAEGSLAAVLWRYEPDSADRPRRLTEAAVRTLASSPASQALSRDLRKRGWRFVGPTTMYAFMQAMGLVNDHVEDCAARTRVERARTALVRPG
jgi:DNA-3-methyladenine glycosylase I